MQRLADQLVGDVGAVVVAGVDMVDAAGDRLPQHGAAAASRSFGGPNTPGPASCMAP